MSNKALLKVVAILTLAATSLDAMAAAGRTPGSFAVSNTGSATYAIPIWTPPGVRGLQPSIALTYDSRAGDGLLGVGWSLSGFGGITRCNRTFAQDGIKSAPQLDADDRFCLNGNRLRLTSGTYGANGSTYRTEIETFSNVIAHDAAGSGPSWFEVKGKDGLTYEYGNSVSSAIPVEGTTSIRVWALNAIRDRDGNSMTFGYNNDTTNGSYRPASINYTFTAGSTTNNSYRVLFTYQSRPSTDIVYGFSIGGKNTESNQLYKVVVESLVNSTWNEVRSYTLSYLNSPTTKRIRLDTVQECVSSDCLLPTKITYQDGQIGWGSESNYSGDYTNMPNAMPIDINGDGMSDLVFANNGTGTWQYLLGSASGLQGPYEGGLASGANYLTAVPIDYNTDGKMDFLVDEGGYWRVVYFTSAGAEFTYSDTGIPATGAGAGRVLATDLNGDGRSDLLYVVTPGGGGWAQSDYLYSRLNTASGLSSTETVFLSFINCAAGGCARNKFTNGGILSSLSQFNSNSKQDFNRDGRGDFIITAASCSANNASQCGNISNPITYSFRVYVSQPGGGYSRTDSGVYQQGSATISSVPLTADFNDDGCTDLAYGMAGYWKIQFGTCFRSGATTAFDSPVGTTAYSTGTTALALDWDGDGRADLVQQGYGASPNWEVFRSTGESFESSLDTGIPFPVSSYTTAFTADINGDGLDDVLYGTFNIGSAVLYSRLHGAEEPDLARSFTDGFGVSASPTYVSITASNYTPYTDSVFPYIDYRKPMWVVNQFSASDGIGGTYSNSFWYYGAHLNVEGRGFQGFRTKRTIDSRNGFYFYERFNRTFPYTGMLEDTILRQTDDARDIATVANLLTYHSYDGGQRVFPYVYQSTEASREVSDTAAYDDKPISSSVSALVFDLWGNNTSVTRTVTNNDPNSPKLGQAHTFQTVSVMVPADEGNWCVGLPSSITQTNSLASTPTIARETTFVPDPTASKCRIKTKTIAPGTQYAVVEVLGFDGFGNVSSVTTTPYGMADRVTLTDWGARGQFPVNSTNAEGEITTFDYWYEKGAQKSVTDANNQITSWAVDNFARPEIQTNPDGTYTVTSYADCAASAACVVGSHGLKILTTAYKVGGTAVFTDGESHLDAFDRPVLSKTRNLTGYYDRNEVRYDAKGRLYQKYMPCVWSSIWTACTSLSTIGFDKLNRPVSETRAVDDNGGSQTSTIEYRGLTVILTDAVGKKSYKYNTAVGNLARSEDHNHYYQDFTYDVFGSVLEVNDSLGNLLSKTSYAYGFGAFKTRSEDMDMGKSPLFWAYTPNAAGEVANYTDAKGVTFTMTYDKLSRPKTRSVPGELDVTWTWGTSATSTSTNRNIGKLIAMAQATGVSETYAYDSRSRIQSRTIVSDASYDYIYSYDDSATGLLDTLTYPTSTSPYRLKLKYEYENGGLKRVKDFNSTTVFWQANAVDSRGHITQEVLGNGLVTNRVYDSITGWLKSIKCGVGGGTCVQNQSYLWDKVGNMTQRQNNNLPLTEDFYYDNLHRLDHSNLNGSENLHMYYDAMGNITSRTDVGNNALWSYDTNKKHQVLQAGPYSYEYDDNGNAKKRNGYNIVWNKYNYPTTINGNGETSTLSYDAAMARWKQEYVAGTVNETTIYVGNELEKVTSNGVTDYRHYIFAPGGPVAIMSRTTTGFNTTRYLHRDALGSITKITDGNTAAEVVSMSFSAFGARRNPLTWSGSPTNGDFVGSEGVTREGYTGHDGLGRTGLIHMGGRVQDSITGRFLSADPFITNPGLTQNFNRYSYVYNNPLTNTDPSGFSSMEKGDCGYCWNDHVHNRWKMDPAETPIASGMFAGMVYRAGTGFIHGNASNNGGSMLSSSQIARINGTGRNQNGTATYSGDVVDAITGDPIPGLAGSHQDEAPEPGIGRQILNWLNQPRTRGYPHYIPVGLDTGIGRGAPPFLKNPDGSVISYDAPGTYGEYIGLGLDLLSIAAPLATTSRFAAVGSEVATIDTALVRFTQSSVSQTLRTGENIGEVAAALSRPGGDMLAASFSKSPIRIFEQNGLLYTLDNRRLLIFSMAERKVPYVWANRAEIAGEVWKNTRTPQQQNGWFIRVGQ